MNYFFFELTYHEQVKDNYYLSADSIHGMHTGRA